MKRFVLLSILALAVLAGRLFAVPEPTAEELKENRAQVEQWHKYPEQIARLRRDLQAFRAQPEARREQILKLDYDLHQESWSTRTRLRNVLDRYAEWLERQSDADRDAIQNAPTKAARIALIQELRNKEWMQGRARVVQDRWNALKADERSLFVRKEREKDRERQKGWQVAIRYWKPLMEGRTPTRFNDLDPRDQIGVKEYLLPMLSTDEKQRLAGAEGSWPGYVLTLVDIADRHPLALPGTEGPRTFAELPRLIQQMRFKGKEPVLPKPKPGAWTEFAVAVLEQNDKRGNKPFPNEFWARSNASLRPPMQEYVDNTLKPALTTDELERLAQAEGKWPAYPVAIRELAEAHRLPAPPWQTALFGPREQWDPYRAISPDDLPDIPRHVLRDYVLYTLSPQQRADLKLSVFDPASMQRVTAKFLEDAKDAPKWRPWLEHGMHEHPMKKGKGQSGHDR